MSFSAKRDRIQVIAEILGICKTPQTQTYIRRHTSISYALLQRCLNHMLLRQWLVKVKAENGQKKLVTTEKGLVFLEKWLELQNIAGIKNKHITRLSPSELKVTRVTCN